MCQLLTLTCCTSYTPVSVAVKYHSVCGCIQDEVMISQLDTLSIRDLVSVLFVLGYYSVMFGIITADV